MGKVIRSRKVVRDVTYKWIPFLFVVLTVIVCTALLSTSGKPPRGIVVTFSVLAGLLVFLFLSCHLMLYCTGIKNQMDTEGANGDNGNADPSSHQLDSNIPPGFLPDTNVNTSTNANANTQVQQRGQDQTEHHNPGRVEQHRHSQYHPDHHMSRHVPTRSPAAQHDARGPNQVAGHASDEPQPQMQAENRVHPYNHPRILEQRLSERSLRRSSAAVDPLRPRRPSHQAESTQQQPRPDPGLEGPPSRQPQSRHTSGGYGSSLHSNHTTRSQTELIGQPPREPRNWHRGAPRDAALPHTLQRSVPDSQFRGSIGVAQQREREMFFSSTQTRLPRASAQANTPADQAEARGDPAETPNSVQAHLALLGGPDVWGLVFNLFSDMKPLASLRRKSADNYLDLLSPVPVDAADLVFLRDTDRKHVKVYPAEPEVTRVRSQKALVQRTPFRDSNDSGYYSADYNQHPQSLPQPAGPSTATSSTLVSPAASTRPPLSSGPSACSSLRAGSEYSPGPNSASSMRSEQTGQFGRESLADEGVIRVTMEQPLRGRRPKPRERSRSC